jgi:hypothetical protein
MTAVRHRIPSALPLLLIGHPHRRTVSPAGHGTAPSQNPADHRKTRE